MPSSPRKPEPVLDERLSAAAAYVRPGARMADIGCDHGKLCAALAARGTCEKIFACDIREKPLARARELLVPYLASGLAECRLGDGLTVLAPGEATDIVIAGVSGVTACQILEAGREQWTQGVRFIFVPPTKHSVLRLFLAENGFALLDETPVCAAGRYYTVMCAEYTGERRTLTPLESAVGRAVKPTAEAHGYLLRVEQLAEKYARGAKTQEEKEMLADLCGQIRKAAESCL